jgi:hypothetical protein
VFYGHALMPMMALILGIPFQRLPHVGRIHASTPADGVGTALAGVWEG